MAVTIGHAALAAPEVGGVKVGDVYRATDHGGGILRGYPTEPRIN